MISKAYISIEYNDEIIDTRQFDCKSKMNEIITMWKKRYSKMYFNADVYITVQSKMNKINYNDKRN